MSQPSVETIRTLNGTGGIEIGNNIANILRNTNAPKIRLFVIDPRKYQQHANANQPSTLHSVPRQNASSGSGSSSNGIEKTEILLSSSTSTLTSNSNGHYVNNHKSQVVQIVDQDEPKLNGNNKSNVNSRKRKTSQDISFKSNGNNISKIYDIEDNDNFDSESKIGRQVKSTQKKQQEFNQTKSNSGSSTITNTTHQEQDQSQSAPKKKKREPPPELQCQSCLKIFLGQAKLRLHYRKFPEHNLNPTSTPTTSTTANNKKKTAVSTSTSTISQITINSLSTSSIPQITLSTGSMKNNDNSQQQQQQQMIPTTTLSMSMQIPSTSTSSVNHNHNNHNHNQFGQLQKSTNKMPKTRPITSSPSNLDGTIFSSTTSRSTNTSSNSMSASLSSLQSNSITINKRTSEISMICNNNNNNNNNNNSMNGNSHLNYHHQNHSQNSSSKSIEELHIQTDPSLNSPKVMCSSSQQQQQMSTNNISTITLASPSSETSNSPASDPFLSPIKLPKPKRAMSMSLYSNSIQQQLNQIHSGGICSPLQGISDTIGGSSSSNDINGQLDQFSFGSNCFRSLTRTTPSPNNGNSSSNSFHHGLGLGPPPPLSGIEDGDLLSDQQQQSPFQAIGPSPSPLSNRSLTTPPLFSQSPTSCTSSTNRNSRSHHSHNQNHFNQNIQSPLTSSSSGGGQKSIWEFAEEKLITLGINQMLLELSDVAEKLAKIARDKIIPIREEEEERSSAPIVQVNNPFLSYLMDLPFGTYVFREEAGRRQPPPPPSATELSNMSLTGSVELDTIDKFLDVDVINLPHLTNLDFGSI